MALTVETGTGASDSESYASVSDADTYHDKRGNTNWATLTTLEKEEALRRATDYMGQVYRLRWDGTRTSSTQALDFPRAFVIRKDFEYSGLNGYTVIGGNYYYPSDTVPVEVKNACIELAFKAAGGELAADLDRKVLKEKIDVIEVTYTEHSPDYILYRSIDNLLSPFLKSTNNGLNRSVTRI